MQCDLVRNSATRQAVCFQLHKFGSKFRNSQEPQNEGVEHGLKYSLTHFWELCFDNYSGLILISSQLVVCRLDVKQIPRGSLPMMRAIGNLSAKSSQYTTPVWWSQTLLVKLHPKSTQRIANTQSLQRGYWCWVFFFLMKVVVTLW